MANEQRNIKDIFYFGEVSKMSHSVQPPKQCCCLGVNGVKRIKVGDIEVGLLGLDKIFKEVRALGIDSDVLKEELLKRVKIYNYVPERREGEYTIAILKAYKTFCKKLILNNRIINE